MRKTDKDKKQSKPPKAKKSKSVSTNEFVNVSDVRGSFLYTKDNMLIQFLKVLPISTALMTDQEKKILTLQMTREISPINIPFKILFLTRPTDVRQLVEYYEGIKTSTIDTKKRDNITKTIRYFSSMALGGGVLERQTFIALWKQEVKQTEDDLYAKTVEFRNALIQSGVTCSICDETDIINMLGLFYNPCFTTNTIMDVTNKYTFMEGGKQ